MTYDEYINSSSWRLSPARLAELESSGYRCRVCNGMAGEVELQVHHRTYERLGNEQVGDLTALCVNCHHTATDDLRRRHYSSRPAMVVPDYKPPLANLVSLSDLVSRGGRA